MTGVGCTRKHHIEVERLTEGEVVEHSILLVKGHIQPPHCDAVKQLRATIQSEGASVEQLTQISAAGEFKLFFELKSSCNIDAHEKEAPPSAAAAANETPYTLQLRYCSGEITLHFSYKVRRSAYRVQPLYVLCQNSTETETELKERCELIDLNLRLVQCVYAHKLRAAGYTNCTFTLNGPCAIFPSQLTCALANKRGEDELWQYFATEILASAAWGQQLQLKFVAFIGCTRYDGAAVAASGDYTYANIRRHLSAHAALGGGGLALFGSAHFYAWPRKFNEIGDCIRSTERIDLTRLPDESNYRRTYGGVYASTLGAVCHELGHCFDLGHTEDGVMGHGFDYLNRVLTVEQCTENLPNRIVLKAGAAHETATPAATSTRPRFTKLAQPLQYTSKNSFLDKYREQRKNDSFYFTRNCAVILAQHKWLRAHDQHQRHSKDTEQQTTERILLDSFAAEIVSNDSPLRLIELRCNINSLVAHYEEFPNVDAGDKAVYRFQLPQPLWDLVAAQQTHYIFVLTVAGDTKRLTCDSRQK